jgi:hypothetical protein
LYWLKEKSDSQRNSPTSLDKFTKDVCRRKTKGLEGLDLPVFLKQLKVDCYWYKRFRNPSLKEQRRSN